ncbi:extracellular solute-binding protein [Paenibacillus qinlingensis]|uniref:Multiple sugar transport system substrate-binding protein n=1 Tax=Paenibacillus qinlingensis TaxID=1837343 RepID=A0ABU1NTF8_9BACL|nr:extracellular solute-binding protein [Paenibacillus qinlingensis]MDR6550341.1 multiple sugar transport system substrate-binding protein [Paenibacillus qinlingensis]
MKKRLSLIPSIVLVMSLVACSNGNSSEMSPSAIPSTGVTANNTSNDQTQASPPGTPAGGKKTIAFSSYFDEDYLHEAEKKYEAMHPNIDIQMTYAHPKGNDANWDTDDEKYLKSINTQMLAGKGPDLLVLDELPMAQYVNKNMLVNISDMMNKDSSFHKEDYFNNILDNSKVNGSLFGMPLSFYMFGLFGDQEAIEKSAVTFDDNSWTWNQFLQAAKVMKTQGGHPYVINYYTGGLLNEMFHESYTTFVDEGNKKASFDSEPFVSLMKQVKQMANENIISQAGSYDTFFSFDNISSINNFIFHRSTYSKTKLYSIPKGEGMKPGGYFLPRQKVGINAKSQVKNEAWDYMRFLSSDAVLPGGFPLNKKAYLHVTQQILKAGTIKAPEEGQLHGKEFKVTEADIKKMDAFISDATNPLVYMNSKLDEIIAKESEAFFKGQKSAEDVAKLIQNKATLLLNE